MTEVAVDHAHNITHKEGASDAGLALQRTEVDAAVRPVVVWLFLTGLAWLLVSTALAAVASLKLHFPELLNFSFLSYGRIEPASDSAFIFGWCATAGLGVMTWVLARLSGRVAPGVTLASLGLVLWNAGILLGVVAILCGKMRPFAGLEFPVSAYLIMAAGFALVAFWVLLSFRGGDNLSVSALFMLGGLAWFGWSFISGNLLIATNSVRGVVQQVVAAWTVSGVIWMFLVPVVLGAAYYFVPKVTGRPVFSGSSGRLMFWLYFLAGGLVGAQRISGGPVPLWLSSVSSAACILLMVPVIASLYVLRETAHGSATEGTSPTLRFTSFGLALLGVSVVLTSIGAVFDSMLHFTMFGSGVKILLVRGAVSMSLFGAIYFIMPRLSGCEWLSSSLITCHFYGAAYGSCLGGAMVVLSGLASGATLSDPESTFSQVIEMGSAYYWGHSLSFIILAVGYLAFALNFLLVTVRIGQPAGEPTLLSPSRSH